MTAVHLLPTILYSGMIGVILFALFETFSRPAEKQTLFLSGLLVLLLVHCGGELFISSAAYQYAPSLAGFEFPLRALLGPALYFYARAAMSEHQRLSIKHCLMALVGPLLVVSAMLPFVTTLSADQKLALADPATRNPEHFKLALFACLMSTAIFLVVTAAYLVATLRLHQQHRQQLLQRFSAIEKRSMDWFKVVLLMWSSAWSLYAIEFAMGSLGWHWINSYGALPVLEALILMMFIHLALKQPVLRQQDKQQAAENKPRSSSLSTSRMQDIADKLKRAMQQDKVFLDEDLSLNQLANLIEVSENHISETLSQHIQSNFFHFVNAYRIEAAQIQLRETDKPISTIAYAVGFNSKSTFNAAFRKFAQCTPTAYRNCATAAKIENVLG